MSTEKNIKNEQVNSKTLEQIKTMSAMEVIKGNKYLMDIVAGTMKATDIKEEKIRNFIDTILSYNLEQLNNLKQEAIDANILTENDFNASMSSGNTEENEEEKLFSLAIVSVEGANKMTFIKYFKDLGLPIVKASNIFKGISKEPYIVAKDVKKDDEKAQKIKMDLEKIKCTLDWK